MANTQAICTSFKQDLFNAVHAFSTNCPVHTAGVADSFKAALYLQSASLGANITSYTGTAGEVSSSGTNYTAGGVAIASWANPTTTGATAFTTPTASFVFTNVTLTSPFDCVLIYNNTIASKNSVAVCTFGAQTITAGTVTLSMPANAASTALLQMV